MQLVQLLREGSLHKAEDLARLTNVSLRTVYRDLDTLVASGVPIEGERGVGYRVTAAITLPPLNLTMAELEALHLGLLSVRHGADGELADAASSLADRLDAVMPEDRGQTPSGFRFATYPFAASARGFQFLPQIRQAIRARQKLSAVINGRKRTLRPLRLDYWGRLWTCIVWCETTRGFDELRLDQLAELNLLPGLFVEEDGKSLADFHRQSQSATELSNGRK